MDGKLPLVNLILWMVLRVIYHAQRQVQQLFLLKQRFDLKWDTQRVYSSRTMRVRLQLATVEQAPEISELRLSVAARLTSQHGPGPWSRTSTVKGVLYDLRHSMLYVATRRQEIIATLALCTKKPWAIDCKHFSKCWKPLYLVSMAVAPEWQERGIGRLCLAEVDKIVAAWPADAIRLDAYAAAAGAGEFYRRCGYAEVGRATYRTIPLIYFEKLWRRNASKTL